MKRIFLPILFMFAFTSVFSQEAYKELTPEEKDALRQRHNATLQFTNSTTGNANKTVLQTKTTEEPHSKIVKVSYYHGTQDSLYKEFKYKKPE